MSRPTGNDEIWPDERKHIGCACTHPLWAGLVRDR
jgi:hypothetical protein